MELENYFYHGGFLMWPLLLIGIISISISLERLFYFFLSYYFIPKDFPISMKLPQGIRAKFDKIALYIFSKKTKNFSRKDHLPFLISLQLFLKKTKIYFEDLRLKNNPCYRILCVYASLLSFSAQKRRSILEREGRQIIEEMKKRISILELVSSIAPLLGLFGTIIGMMQTFQVMEQGGGQASTPQLAGGIWVAMITTIFGLFIALISHLSYYFLNSILEKRIVSMNALVQYYEETLFSKN